jgi:4-hydroxybenzoate polyprenyltransferase
MKKVRNYLSLVKFSHTIFAMPFAFIGFFLAWKQLEANEQAISADFYPPGWLYYEPALLSGLWQKLLLIILCMVFARSAAMAFNRYLDRQYDAKNPRTAVREIPAGVIPARNALLFTVISSLLFIVCTFLINRICFYLSPVALAVVLGYSYTKRFTVLCHLVLGLGLSLAPLGAYLAVTGTFALLPVLFSISVIFWVSGFDIIYAMQDVEFDRSQQLYSIPVWAGQRKGLRVSEFFHVVSAAAIIYAGYYGRFGWLYWFGVAVFGGMLIYQHWLVKPNDLSRVNIAFMTANGIASVVFAIFVIADLLTGSSMLHLGTYPFKPS